MGFFVSTPVKHTALTLPTKLAHLPKSHSFPKRSYLPEYIYPTKTGLLIFRMKVPLDCRPLVTKRELQFSLKTRCIYSARKHIAPILTFLNGVFEDIRTGTYNETTGLWLQQFIADGIRQTIRGINARTSSNARNPSNDRTSSNGQGFAFVFPQQKTTLQSIQDASASPLPPASPSHPLALSEQPECQPTFTSIKESFLKEKELSNGWRLKTHEDHVAVFSLFVEVFGDLPVTKIDKATMRDFKSILIQLPPNMRKIARYKDKSIKEIVAMKPEVTLSAHTVNKYLSRLSNLFSYAVSHGYMTANPAGGLKVKLKSRPDEEREAYTTADLMKLFVYHDKQSLIDNSKPYCKWAPLIALYSGCRLEEICQLHLEDIRNENGVLVFDINDKHEKRLKTLSSARLVPIHPMLIEKGLIQYVYELKAKGEKRLFPELRQRRDGYGQTVSKWFQRYKKTCGIDEGKTFHSFRHTFITHLKHKQVDPFMIHELDGHAIDSETMGRYGKRYTPEILLREAIEKIDYEIEFSD